MGEVWPSSLAFEEVQKRPTAAAKRDPVTISVTLQQGTPTVTVSVAPELMSELGWKEKTRIACLISVAGDAVFLRLLDRPRGGYTVQKPPGAKGEWRGLLRLGCVGDVALKEVKRAPVQHRLVAGKPGTLDLRLETLRRWQPASPAEKAAAAVARDLMKQGIKHADVLRHLDTNQNFRADLAWLAKVGGAS